jgi:beta-glucanase (GH16 family)
MRPVLLLAGALLFGCAPSPSNVASGQWELSWSDEFDGAAMTPPDPQVWSYDLGGGGWGHGEQQYHTKFPENAHHDGSGNLVIQALKKRYAGNEYTSARIRTKGTFEQKYGRFEASIQLPTGQGIWPAFWMLGADFPSRRWPDVGEIDIMEARGHELQRIHGSAHGPGYSAGESFTKFYDLPGGGHFRDGFHRFAVEWEPQKIRWFVDDVEYLDFEPKDLRRGHSWAFDGSGMFLILNVAVGGAFAGGPVDPSVLPQQMKVEWVRAYQRAGGYPAAGGVNQ